MKKCKNLSIFVVLSMLSFTIASCLSDGDETIILEDADTGIPSDALAGDNPYVDVNTTSIPNVNYTVEKSDGKVIIKLDMTGIQDVEDKDWLYLIGTALSGQNVWVSVDGKGKGILVINLSDENSGQTLVCDLTFVVDNSGSMSQEADAVARDIIDWAQELAESKLDMRFACVGYSEYGYVNGAMDFNDAEALSGYLNRSTGLERTRGFSGPNATRLQELAEEYGRVTGECGAMALRYANDYLDFRNGVNRVYVNFTDEGNQPNGYSKWSVEYFSDQNNWGANQGTVHTVFSQDTTYYSWSSLSWEKPWLISEYTGGTILYAPASFSGVTLSDLPVTGAMTHSYIIMFTNVEEYLDGQDHEVKITIVSSDGKTKAEKTFYINFGTL